MSSLLTFARQLERRFNELGDEVHALKDEVLALAATVRRAAGGYHDPMMTSRRAPRKQQRAEQRKQ